MRTPSADVITPAGMPGYSSYFPMAKNRITDVGHLDPPVLHHSRRSNNVLSSRTSAYHDLKYIPYNCTRPDDYSMYAMNQRAASSRRAQGFPRYGIFNCVDRDEITPETTADDVDRLDRLASKAKVYDKIRYRPTGYFHKPVTTNHMFTEANVARCASNILPFTYDYNISPHLYKVWEDVHPIFDRASGMISNDLWGIQEKKVSQLPDIKRMEYRKSWYPDLDDYQRKVANRAVTARKVASLKGIDDYLTQPYVRRIHVPAETNVMQKRNRHLDTIIY